MNRGVLDGKKRLFLPEDLGVGDPANDGKLLQLDSTVPGGVKLLPNGTYVPFSVGSRVPQIGAASRPLVPFGVKVKGANIVPKASDAGSWTSFWSNWDWVGWIKPQVDSAVSVGANCVRLIGGLNAVIGGSVTQATYLAQWKQLLDYCASIGIYVYPCGGDFTDGLNSTTLNSVPGLLAAHAALLNLYSNVIGFDLINEAMRGGNSVGLTTGTLVANWAVTTTATVKAVTTLPLTYSAPDLTPTTSAQWTDARIALLAPAVDFFDFHVYYAAAASDPNGYVNLQPTKPFIIGEFGAALSAGSAAQTALIAAMSSVANRPDCLGALLWAITDQDTVSSNQWGMFDATFTARPALTVPFQQLPSRQRVQRITLTNGGNVTLNGGTGVFTSAAGYAITLQYQCAVRVKATIVADTQIKTAGDLLAGALFIDIVEQAPQAIFGTAVVRSTTTQTWDYFAAAGVSHTYQAAWAILSGSGTTDVINGGQTELILEVEAA